MWQACGAARTVCGSKATLLTFYAKQRTTRPVRCVYVCACSCCSSLGLPPSRNITEDCLFQWMLAVATRLLQLPQPFKHLTPEALAMLQMAAPSPTCI